MGGDEVERLIGMMARLPGLGPRSARRAVLRMLQKPEAQMLPLAAALTGAARAVRTCSVCGNLDTADPCAVCTNPHRDRAVICVVEGVGDLWRWNAHTRIAACTTCSAARSRRSPACGRRI